MNYKNQICPVCKKLFCDDDDVVVCPVCGTPHHRDCYREYGKCMNSELHSTGFIYKTVNEEADTEKSKEKADKNIYNDEINQNKREYTEEILTQIKEQINSNDSENVFIEGRPVKYYEAAVGKNQRYFIPRFLIMDKTDKKVVYNFTAFLFPFAWTLYRKLYKFAAAVLAFYFVIICASVLPVVTNKEYMDASVKLYTAEGVEGLSNIIAYSSDENVKLTDAETEFLKAAENNVINGTLSVSVQVAVFVVRILMGFFATRLYKDSTVKKVERACELYGDEGSVIQYLKRTAVIPFAVAVIASLADIFTFIMF